MEKDPGRVLTEVNVTLRHPRNRKDTAFQALVDKVYALVAGRTEPEAEALGTAPGLPGRTATLPIATLIRLAGLLETVHAEESNQLDLYRLTEDLKLELDDVLPVVEVAEMLGFAVVDQGDIKLTPLGEAFADASIVARKEILEQVWDLKEDTDTRAIDNFIVRLRRYIENDPTKPKHLITVRGLGYQFVAKPE